MSNASFSECRQHLRSIVESSGKTRNFAELLEHGKLIAELHGWCLSSLSTEHMVRVASALNAEFEISESEMEQLGVPVDLLKCFPNWIEGSREGFSAPPPSILPPRFGVSQKFGLLRLQLSPFSPTLSAALLLIRRLVENLEKTVKFSIAVEPGGNLEVMREIVAGFGEGISDRVSLIELQTASIFAQDNARGARTESGQPVLHIPREFRKDRERAREALHLQLSDQSLEIPVLRSSLFWEGGNIVNDCSSCFIGVDHIRENMVRLGLTKDEVIALFHSEFGEHVEFIGAFDETAYHRGSFRPFSSGQACFHVDLDLHLLGQINGNESPVALLASPEMGLKHSDFILSKRRLVSDHFMSEAQAREHIAREYSSYAEERIERLKLYRRALETKGYRVVAVPDVRIKPRDNLFSTRNLDFIYSNVLSASHRGAPTIFYLPYRVHPLDDLAEKAYRKAGCNVVRVSQTGRLANLLMLFSGGLRCVCSQVY